MALFGGRSDDDRDDDERGPWGSRGFVASVIVMVAVVICGLSLLFLGGSDDPESAPSPSSTAPSQSQPTEPGPTEEPTTSVRPTASRPTEDPTPIDPTPPPARPGPCKIKAGDQRIASTAPASVLWKFESGMLVPSKANIGPGARDADGVSSCYAHSPIGAVFAAMNTLAQVRDESLAAQVIERRMAANPGRTRALAEARMNRTNPTPARAAADVQFVGFKIIDYTPSRTVLSLAVQTDVEHIGGMAVTLRWVDGDWRIALRSDGSISGDPDVLSALDGYVRFRGA